MGAERAYIQTCIQTDQVISRGRLVVYTPKTTTFLRRPLITTHLILFLDVLLGLLAVAAEQFFNGPVA